MASPGRPSAEFGGYVAALLMTAAAALLRLLLSAVWGDQAPFFPFVVGVLVAAWYGGLKPGLLATALGAVLGTCLMVQPVQISWTGTSGMALIVGLFLVVGVTASCLCGALHIARRRTQKAEEQIRSVVDTVIDGIITIDETAMIQSLNPAAEKLFGYQAKEVMGQNVNVLMPEPYHSQHDGYVANYLRTGQAKIIGIGREVVGRRKDGSTFPMELAVSEFRLGAGRYFTGIVRDITQRKQAEEALRRSEAQFRQVADALKEADRRKDEFLATLAHELVTPWLRFAIQSNYFGVWMGTSASSNRPVG